MNAVPDQLITIPEANLWRVQEAFKKLATRAKRTKLAAPVYVVVSSEFRMVKASELGLKGEKEFSRVYVTLQVAGNRPHIPGYTFLGAVNHGEKMNVLSAAPDQEVPERFRVAKPLCDHCGTQRKRKDTFILRHDATGEIRQIARNCLQDYLGEAVDVNDIVQQFTWWRAAMDTIGECGGWGSFCGGEGRGDHEDIAHYLAVVAVLVRKFGWTSRGAAREHASLTATSGEAWRIMYPPANLKSPEMAEILKSRPEAQDVEMAALALEWIRSRPDAELVGYIGNVAAACQEDSFCSKHDGFVASLVGAAYPKAMGFERERAEKPVSQHVGAVKERLRSLELEIKVQRFSEVPVDFGGGYSTWMVLEDASGNKFTWKCSRDLEGEADQGDTIVIDGTVKEHTTHEKYGKSTVLTRCKILEVKKKEEAA